MFQSKAKPAVTVQGGRDESYCNAFQQHMQKCFGESAVEFPASIQNNGVVIDIYGIAPSDTRPFWTFVTCGIGAKPMGANEKRGKRCELALYLPPDWAAAPGASQEWQWGWPIIMLSHLADCVHGMNLVITQGHLMTFDAGRPVQTTSFTDILFWDLQDAAHAAHMNYEGKKVDFLQVVPITDGEKQMALDKTPQKLMQLVTKYKAVITDPTRPSVLLQEQNLHDYKQVRQVADFSPYKRPLFHDMGVLDTLVHDVWSEMGDSRKITAQSQDGTTQVVLQRAEQDIHVFVSENGQVVVDGRLSSGSRFDDKQVILKPALIPLPEPARLSYAASIISMCKGNWWTRD